MRDAVHRVWGAPTGIVALVLWAVLAASATAATFGAPVVVTGKDAGEPGIDVTNTDGTIYVNAPSGLLSNAPGGPSYVFRSTDGGASWVETPAGARANLPGGGDSDISLDPVTGAIAMTDLWLGSATVSKSTDRGNTWTANPAQGTAIQDRQWVAQAGGGVVYHVTHQIPAGLIVARSIDGGATYPTQHVAATPADQTGCVCPPGTMVAEGSVLLSGKVGVIYATSTGGVKFARSTNSGLTFSQATVSPASNADTGSAFPVVANAGGGKLVAVWQENLGGRSYVKYSSSTNWGQSWASPRTLVGAGTPLYPWVDSRGSKVAVSLYHNDAQATPDTVPEGSTWYERYLESADGGATFSALQTVDPTPVKSGPVCQEGVNCSGDRELLDFQSVFVDSALRPNLTWTRSINEQTQDTEIRFARGG
jgi:hypothetical protein